MGNGGWLGKTLETEQNPMS